MMYYCNSDKNYGDMKIEKQLVYRVNGGTFKLDAVREALAKGYKFLLFNGVVFLIDSDGDYWDVGIKESDII